MTDQNLPGSVSNPTRRPALSDVQMPANSGRKLAQVITPVSRPEKVLSQYTPFSSLHNSLLTCSAILFAVAVKNASAELSPMISQISARLASKGRIERDCQESALRERLRI